MNHFRSFAFLALLFVGSMYTYWISNRDFEWIVPYMNDRAPAAVRESQEFQKIIEKPMRVFKREAVVSSITIDNHKGRQHVSLGQFPVEAAKGQNLVCLEYPFVRLVLAGEGAAVAGRKTQLSVVAPCLIHPKNRDRVSDIPLPFDELYRRPAQNQEFKWSETIDVKIDNVYGDWPRLWELESIEFFKDPADEQRIVLSKAEFLKKMGEPILIRYDVPY